MADTFWNGHFPFIDYSTIVSIAGMIRAAEVNVAGVTDKTIVIPGHGPIGNKSQLTQFRDMLLSIREKVSTLKKEGKSRDEVVAAKPTADYDAKWGGFIVNGDFFTRLVYAGVYPLDSIEGMTNIPSNFGPKETMDRLEAEIRARGMTVFARIDHAAGAAGVGLNLRPTELIIFGNARGGTPLMQSAQTIGIDLPLKALVWQDAAGKTWISYNEPSWIAQRHGVTNASNRE